MLRYMRGSQFKGITSYTKKYANVEENARMPFLRDYFFYEEICQCWGICEEAVPKGLLFIRENMRMLRDILLGSRSSYHE
jgi:hypothetical protein